MRQPFALPVPAGAFALCLLLSGCGLKGSLYLREPPVVFPATPPTAAPSNVTIQAPPAATLAPGTGSLEAPAAATHSPVTRP